ncbi:ThiJ/PfpI family protein [Tothia fuscella]|uniref:ThiJ/PfpI family protein n=1 Tax=Tothia fuscella TaxID=1048955 RepID=A0A9P4NH05_9PEZI|nr:ThiJ/PfpI family protein [Tothia fuscella]
MAAFLPRKYGIVVFTGFQALDVFGPLATLNVLSRNHKMELSIIAESLTPVSTNPEPNEFVSSSFGQEIVPTHTFENAPELDVLIIPGGFGTRNTQKMLPIKSYLLTTFPTLKYCITICTGSAILASTDLLNSRRATTNKATYSSVTSPYPKVNWVRKARWVVDDSPGVTPVWSSSGVSAGIDVTFAFVEMLYGRVVAGEVADIMEYDRCVDGGVDRFADVWAEKEKEKGGAA